MGAGVAAGVSGMFCAFCAGGGVAGFEQDEGSPRSALPATSTSAAGSLDGQDGHGTGAAVG